MKQISTVLFDLGNVLIYIDFNAFWHDLGLFRMEEIVPYRDGYAALTLQYETGYISTDDYLYGLRTVFNNKFTIIQLEKAFSSIIRQPVEGVTDIVQRVSITHQTALVSNTNEIHYKLSLTKFECLKILQKHYLSYRLRVMKPARGFYDAIIKDQGIHSSQMLFIDDLEENVNSAKSAGMQTVLFESTKQLKADLENLGIL
jgi:HAD superfamily hydrolase (TIGR01509 family)